MSVRGVDIKVGDKLRYLGGDLDDGGIIFSEGECYTVKAVNSHSYTIEDNFGKEWNVAVDGYNSDCFEKVEEDKSEIDLIANLAQEVAQLKRELDDLRNAMQTQAYAFDERLESILSDNDSEPKLKRVVYEYVE